MKRLFLATCGLVFLVIASSASQTPPQDNYYLVVFASEGQPRLPKLSHTFATFIKTTGDEDPKTDKIEMHTISWLPESLVIELRLLRPEAGKNLDLPATLAFAKSLGTQVSSWGPFAIKKELYDRALKQIELLNSGKIAYIALDRRFRGQGASNCFHAISDLDTDNGLLDTGTSHGKEASQEVVNHLAKWMIPAKEDLEKLYDRLAIPKEVERIAPSQKVTAR
jgi:hypothetical protein